MRLSKRLELVVSFAGREQEKNGAEEIGEPQEGRGRDLRVADVGTDHGYVPIALALECPAVRAIAMDVRPGPLGRAREHIAAWGLEDRIETRLSDGVEKLKEGEADTVVIAGMGGELVIHILEGGRRLWAAVKRWVLSPQSELDKVRRYLDGQGFVIEDEAMVEEEGKYYTVMEVIWSGRPGKAESGTERQDETLLKARYLYGPRLLEKKDPVLKLFLEREERQIAAIIGRLECRANLQTIARREELRERLFLVRRAMEEIEMR